MAPRETVWVFGDQLNRAIGALATASPDTHRVLLVTAADKIASRPWHPARVSLITRAIEAFAQELRAEGFEVDHQHAPSMRDGLAAHRAAHSPERVIVTEPNSYTARRLVAELGCESVRSNQFLCHTTDFDGWADGRKSFKMEDFYRWQRRRLGYLMDGEEPAGGEWNYDEQNRERPPKDGHDRWPVPVDVWATTRAGALERLEFFVTRALPMFGPHEDAMLSDNWHLAHGIGIFQFLGAAYLGRDSRILHEAIRVPQQEIPIQRRERACVVTHPLLAVVFAVAAVVAHATDVCTSRGVRLGRHLSAVGVQRHADHVGHHHPLSRVDERIPHPARELLRVHSCDQGEVAEHHESRNVVHPAARLQVSQNRADAIHRCLRRAGEDRRQVEVGAEGVECRIFGHPSPIEIP
ncbi:MAG: cryptochrome/photolyase family protein, partial [Actinomycetota bacterium]